ncbi:MAG: DUF4173 domain-containing protein [Sphingobacteriaceae bacterium]|nr:DUF4173 domain-containing protein [Cytophagaceae bacterium]
MKRQFDEVKPRELFLLLSVGAYSYLFYEQSAGMNYLLFAALLVGMLAWLLPECRRQPAWRAVAAGTLVAALGVALNGSFAAIALSWISFVLLAGLTFAPASSLPVAFLNGFLSEAFLGFFLKTINWLSTLRLPTGLNSRFGWQRAGVYGIPVLVTVGFYELYALANPDFGQLLAIDWPAYRVKWPLVFFTLWGLVWLSGLFHPWGIEALVNLDRASPDVLRRRRGTKRFRPTLALRWELRAGVLTLTMLNALLVFFLLFDLAQVADGLPVTAEKGYSQYVHEGVNALILSVVMAIGVLLYFFRNSLNFYAQNQRIKTLAYGWVALNALLLAVTAYKNGLYIGEFGLTHKRIGVHVWLLLTAAGLLTTLLKVWQVRSNWFLFRRNAWIGYAVLLAYALVPWARVMAWYNLDYARNRDVTYLTTLGSPTLPQLLTWYKAHPDGLRPEEVERLRKITRDYFQYHPPTTDWRSLNFEEWRAYNQLKTN